MIPAGHTVPPPLVQQSASISDDGKEEEMMAMTAAIMMAKRCRQRMPDRRKELRLQSGLLLIGAVIVSMKLSWRVVSIPRQLVGVRYPRLDGAERHQLSSIPDASFSLAVYVA
jgi:hypothetical protein